jgi:hypothetical protein
VSARHVQTMFGCRRKRFKIEADKNGWHHLTTDKGWRRPFADPIPPPPQPRARHARGCRDLHHEAAEGPSTRRRNGKAAMQALILVATKGGPTMLARIGIMRALNRHVERVFEPSGKKHHWESGSLSGTNEKLSV